MILGAVLGQASLSLWHSHAMATGGKQLLARKSRLTCQRWCLPEFRVHCLRCEGVVLAYVEGHLTHHTRNRFHFVYMLHTVDSSQSDELPAMITSPPLLYRVIDVHE